MELYYFGLLGVMVITVVVLKSIACWTQCYNPAASMEMKKFLEKKKKELSASKRQLVQLEIPMEDIDRTSTPVPNPRSEHNMPRSEHHSDV